MDKQELIERTKEFAHRCVKLALDLPKNYLGNHIKGQLIRCSTSVAQTTGQLVLPSVEKLLSQN